MRDVALVAAGGAAGSLARAACTGAGGPWAVAAVNVAGCLLMGVLAAWLAAPGRWPGWAPLLSTGFLGGFTTLSAWAAAVVTLLACVPAYLIGRRLPVPGAGAAP
ncbi:FluC/FEX family fluoride channel [Corynebacterium sp. 335C]